MNYSFMLDSMPTFFFNLFGFVINGGCIFFYLVVVEPKVSLSQFLKHESFPCLIFTKENMFVLLLVCI